MLVLAIVYLQSTSGPSFKVRFVTYSIQCVISIDRKVSRLNTQALSDAFRIHADVRDIKFVICTNGLVNDLWSQHWPRFSKLGAYSGRYSQMTAHAISNVVIFI
jgi:hypothetical protein